MAGRNAVAAVKAFTGPIQRALTCFAHGRVSVDSYDPESEGILQFNRADDVALNGPGEISLSVAMRYRIVKTRSLASPGKPWKVSTTGWIYALKAGGAAVADFHWHPTITPQIPFPHVHASSDRERRHLPTGRVLIEDLLTLAVECGAQPAEPEKWEGIRARNLENFGKGATWGFKAPGSLVQYPGDLPH